MLLCFLSKRKRKTRKISKFCSNKMTYSHGKILSVFNAHYRIYSIKRPTLSKCPPPHHPAGKKMTFNTDNDLTMSETD